MNSKSFLVNQIPTLNPQDISSLSDFKIIDVRSNEEFTGDLGHIENAKLVTLGPELEEFLNSSDKHRPLIFVCRSGGRSAQATKTALQAGFDEVYNMAGGMMQWNALGFPIKR
jgi:hydroxyacylglutathione hydrolase